MWAEPEEPAAASPGGVKRQIFRVLTGGADIPDVGRRKAPLRSVPREVS